MAPPICGSVPPPNSSINSSVLSLLLRIICFMFVRWLEYVLRSFSMLCSSPMSIIMLSNMPTRERSPKGTGSPHCIMYCSRPTVFRQTDLPPAFGPDIIRMNRSRVSIMSSGTTCLPCLSRDRRSNGCMACIQSMCGKVSTWGSTALVLSASSALACMRSIWARKW